MTIETQQGKRSWIGDGSTTSYPYSYPFLNTSDIEVYLDGNKQTSGFSVQNKTDYSTGANIIFDVAPAEGVLIVIRRNIPMTQEISYPENGEFPAKSHEKSLDKLTMLIIDNNKESLKVNPATSDDFNPVFPVPEANKALKITADGKGFTMSDYDPDTALALTEDFKSQAQQAAIESLAFQQAAANSEQIASNKATIATKQAEIAIAKTSEVVESGNNAITAITAKGTEQIELIQNEGATQIANVQSTGFYMRDDKLYFINSQGEETEFKSGGSGLEIGDIGMALYVDETKGLRRYLNGQVVDINTNTQAFLNRLLEIKNTNPDYFTTEENWQSEATLNIDGCVYKFVLNYASDGETVVSVRLPKYPDYVEINAGGTLPVVGNGMTLGLSAGNGRYCGMGLIDGNESRFSMNSYGVATGSVTTDNNLPSIIKTTTLGVTTDPTKSGLETTLNQTKLKMRYFIQIATGSETENTIINEIELNNPYSLFDSKYSNHELNNLSWLKSSGQWNAKSVYPTAYNKLLKVYNGTETVEGLSVKLSTETYTDYDFVLNTADETFRLPLKNHTADDSIAGLTLYFYIGETVQNANLIDAGRIEEQLANKLDRSAVKAYITETYQNGTSWYRVYSDGWCEQGDTEALRSYANSSFTRYFLKPFKDTNYTLLTTAYSNQNVAGWYHYYETKTTNSFTTHYNVSCAWRACGYIA